MKIRWFGHSFFEIAIKNKENKEILIHTDPYDKSIGLNPPKNLSSNLVLISHNHPDHNNLKVFKTANLTLDTAGEFSVNGAEIKGILTYHDKKQGAENGINIIYTIEAESIRIAHLGNLGHILTDDQVNEIGKVDVLIVPVGGGKSLNGEEAAKVVKQLEPKVVIPMHYKIPGLKMNIDDTEKFCDNLGICPQEPVSTYVLRANNIPRDEKELEIVIFKKQK